MDKHKRVDLATQIFAEHEPVIRAMIRQYATDPEEEDEIYQNLYLSLVCHPPPQPLLHVPAYLNTVIRNDIIDMIRRRKGEVEIVSQYATAQVRDELEESPEERLVQAEDIEYVTGLMSKLLPAREAVAVMGRYVYGHDLTDLASHMQVKERTVSRYACLGIKRIREAVLKGRL